MENLHVAIPLGLYSITSAMFFPISQSLVYFKVCLQSERVTNILAQNCTNRSLVSSNQYLQSEANFVFLISNIVMTLVGTFATILIGKLGDERSRKIALIIPFLGLILSDVTLLLQSYFIQVSVYWFLVSEFIFGVFGGYGSILSACFAYASNFSRINQRDRSKEIARLEGAIGVGSVFGFTFTTLIPFFGQSGYFNGFLFMTFIHVSCFISLMLLKDIRPMGDEPIKKKSVGKAIRDKFTSWTTLFRSRRTTSRILVLVTSFSLSFFAFMGTTHILFYYLKQRFQWDMRFYAFLKAPLQICSTLAILFLYPYLKTKSISDSTLAIIGLFSRCLGRFWLAIAWNSYSVFLLVFIDMFTKFSPAALRSLLSKSVTSEEQGQIFSLLGVSEMIFGLLASLAFHTLFPFSISFFPQLSFVLMGAAVLLPITLVVLYRKQLSAEVDPLPNGNEMKNIEVDHQVGQKLVDDPKEEEGVHS